MWTYKHSNSNIKWKKLNVLKFSNFQFKLLRFSKITSKGSLTHNVAHCVLEPPDHVTGESILSLNCVLFTDKTDVLFIQCSNLC